MYKPVEDARAYLANLYNGIKDITQKITISLMPSSGLELAVSGVPNSVFNESTTQTPDKLKGYLFADYGVKSYQREGRNVVVTRTDGKRITLSGAPKNVNAVEQYVRGFLWNRGVRIDNKTVEKIAKLLREKA